MENYNIKSNKNFNNYNGYNNGYNAQIVTKTNHKKYDSYNPFEYYVKNGYLIILDTCTLMHEDFHGDLTKKLKFSLKDYGKTVCIPAKVEKEINKHLKDPTKYEDASRARKTINYFKKCDVANVLNGSAVSYEAKKSRFADAEIESIVEGEKAHSNILLITQDKNLSNSIISKKRDKAVKTKKIIVKYVANGELVDYTPQPNYKQQFERKTNDSANSLIPYGKSVKKDEYLKLFVGIEQGVGVYKKNEFLVFTKEYINFKLKVEITDNSYAKISKNYKILKVEATVKDLIGETSGRYRLSTNLESLTEIDLPSKKYKEGFTVSVKITYQIELDKQKELSTSVCYKI